MVIDTLIQNVDAIHVLRRSSAARLEQAAQKMELPPASGYGALVQDLDDLYQGELGLALCSARKATGSAARLR